MTRSGNPYRKVAWHGAIIDATVTFALFETSVPLQRQRLEEYAKLEFLRTAKIT